MTKMENFQYFSIKSFVVDVYWNRLTEAILIHIQNICFYGDVMIIMIKPVVFSDNFVSTETLT